MYKNFNKNLKASQHRDQVWWSIVRDFASNPYLQMDNNKIDLLVDVDRVPLYQSLSTQIWLIICKFANYPPFIVSLFCGSEKPDASEKFLHQFLHDFGVLRETGFQNGKNIFLINVGAFVCDASARQFLKYVKSYTGYFGC